MQQGQQRLTHPLWLQPTRTPNSFPWCFDDLQGNLRDPPGSSYVIFKFEMLCNSQGFNEDDKANIIQFQSEQISEEDNKDTVQLVLSSLTPDIKIETTSTLFQSQPFEECIIENPILVSFLRCLICNHELTGECGETVQEGHPRRRRSRPNKKIVTNEKKLSQFFSTVIGLEEELRELDENYAFETNEKAEFQFCSTCKDEISILYQLHIDLLDVKKKFEDQRDKLSSQIVETFVANEKSHISEKFLAKEHIDIIMLNKWKKMCKDETIRDVAYKENEAPGGSRFNCKIREKGVKMKIRKLMTVQNINSHFNTPKLSLGRKENNILIRVGAPREKLKLTCRKCSASFFKFDSFSIHLRRHKMKKKRKLLNCFTCNKKFESRKTLYQHKLTHMSDSDRKMHCIKCDVMFEKRSLYNSHVKTHSGKTFICDICNSIHENQTQLKKHMAFHLNVDTSEPDLYSCKTCSKTYLKADDLNKHLEIHENKDVIGCEFCGAGFKSDYSLKEHLKIFHSGGNPYLCEVADCNHRFSSESLMISHLKSHRPKEFVCPDCGNACRSRDGLRKHLLTHKGKKPFQCSQCDMGFIERKSFDSHMAKHTGKFPFVCNLCPQSAGFKDSKLLRKHKFQLHPETIKADKKFTCEYCWHGFNSSESLATHAQKTHEKYKCNSCDRVFKLGDHLRRHMYIHTGEKPYKCNLCDKAFNQESNLKEHLYRHSGIRPHQCTICIGVGFLRRVHLKDHMIKEHGISEVPSLPMGRAASNARKVVKQQLQVPIAKPSTARKSTRKRAKKNNETEPESILPTLEFSSIDPNSYIQVDSDQERQFVYIVNKE